MRILIVGAGIAGLTLAAFLKQRGIKPTVIEKAKHWTHVGFSILIWNNGRRVLKELNVEKIFDKKGCTYQDYFFANGHGKIIALDHFKDFVKKYWPPKVLINRADLHKILLNASGCNFLDTSSMLNKADIYECINSEIYDPFIWLLFPLGAVFIICGWLEGRAEKRGKR